MITKGTFKDGHQGWKVRVLEPNHSLGIARGYEIIHSDNEEVIAELVYTIDDANLIAAAPTMYDLLNRVKNVGIPPVELLKEISDLLTQLDNQK